MPRAPPAPTPRSIRSAADARYGAFAAGTSPGAPGAASRTAPEAESPGCAYVVFNHPVLFVQQRGTTSAIDSHDIKQGSRPDCFLLATLCAMATLPEGRALLHSAIVENKDQQGRVVSYTVKFHRPEPRWGGLAKPAFHDVAVQIDARFSLCDAIPLTTEGREEIWPLVVAKAYTTYAGGYSRLADGGFVSDAMEALTGRTAEVTELKRVWIYRSYAASDLQRDLAAGKAIVLETGASPANQCANAQQKNCLQPQHAYAVTGTTVVQGRLCVTVHNPWNDGNDPAPIPVDDLDRYFVDVTVGSVR